MPDLERTELTLFPTTSKNEGTDRGFFGSVINQTWETFGFDIQKDIEWIKVYEDQEDTEESIYIEFDSTELRSSKVILLHVSTEEPQAIKISYSLWLPDNNGNYRMKDSVLRNDGFHKKNPLPIENDLTEFLFSSVSGSLVGTRAVEKHPILDLKNT
jgi:hypothetical protein